MYIDTEQHLKGFQKRYIGLHWSQFTQEVLECVADTDLDIYSEAASCESVLCSYIYDLRALDEDVCDEWRVYVVMHFLKDGFTTLWTAV